MLMEVVSFTKQRTIYDDREQRQSFVVKHELYELNTVYVYIVSVVVMSSIMRAER